MTKGNYVRQPREDRVEGASGCAPWWRRRARRPRRRGRGEDGASWRAARCSGRRAAAKKPQDAKASVEWGKERKAVRGYRPIETRSTTKGADGLFAARISRVPKRTEYRLQSAILEIGQHGLQFPKAALASKPALRRWVGLLVLLVLKCTVDPPSIVAEPAEEKVGPLCVGEGKGGTRTKVERLVRGGEACNS